MISKMRAELKLFSLFQSTKINTSTICLFQIKTMEMTRRIVQLTNIRSFSPFLTILFAIFITLTLNLDERSVDPYVFGQATTSENVEQSIPANKVKSYQALSLENGKPITVANATGDSIVLNSWATWCIPCREEMPGLEQLYEEYKDKGLEVIGVSVDSFGMDDWIKLFTERMNITYPIWHDPNDAFTRTFKAIRGP